MDPRSDPEIIRTNVTEWLETRGVPHKLHWHAPVHNVREAAAVGLDFDQALLIKTLAYKTPCGWLLVAMRALDRVDHAALAKAVAIERRKLRFADHSQLEHEFGWHPGGAAPITMRDDVVLLVEEAVFRMPKIFLGGGRRDLTIEAEPLARISHSKNETSGRESKKCL